MSKTTKKEMGKILKDVDSIDYEKLRLDVLKGLSESRNIDCKNNKEDIIKHLKLDDEGKYIRPVTYEKYLYGKFLVGIDIKDQSNILQMSKLVDSNQSQKLNLYSNDRLYYISSVKLT